jgi:hypothetical protein
LPEEVRLDNGCPWGGWYDLPTAFALWLLGLGLRVHFNAAGRPQENGVIERANGTGQRWAEVRQCTSAAQLQEQLNAVDEIQREYMPSLQGKSRMQAYPALKHSGRNYSRPGEEAHWSLERAEAALETHVARRKLGKQGHLSLYYRRVYVSQQLRGSEVRVQYDSGSKMWVVSTDAGEVLRSVPALEVIREKIMNLTMYEEEKVKRRSKG